MAAWRLAAITLACLAAAAASSSSAEPDAVARGEKALLGRSFTPPTLALSAYQNAWRRWGDGATQPPEPYAQAFREHYGLHPAPYPNGGYPMGLREGNSLFGKALSTDCLLCHGGSILGQSYVGLPNTTGDIQALLEDLSSTATWTARTPFRFCSVRGTSEAAAVAVFLFGLREPDLSLRSKRLDLGLRDDLCEDAPAWWLLKKKTTMYHTGGADARSVRSLMQFMLSPLNSASKLHQEEATFADIQAYLRSLQPPKYPFPVDQSLAQQGATIFKETCSRCHGTYGANWTYPNRIVPLDEIGTDPSRQQGLSKEFIALYNKSWFAHERSGWLMDEFPGIITGGYQAPPLDGIWATAPYFHNGSVPTVYHVLNSKSRPRIYTRSFRTDATAYDREKLGWKVQILERGADPQMSVFESRKIYDTMLPGRGNGGHTFGDHLSDAERWAVIEYLKTL
jgi:mono/diheme cytochrome c family protein